jgi:putative flavoprotein involved in K+ transport
MAAPPAASSTSTLVIGAGPSGLATAAMLRAAGVDAIVVDRARENGSSWRAHYDRLHLHTARRWSGLPGLAIPSSYGPWVGRDDFVAYLESYARHHGIEPRLGVEVRRLERAENGWSASTASDAIAVSHVVVATGYNHTPHLPSWPGRFDGELLHASRYRNATPYRGRKVLVVGTGNSGAEIAVDLVEGGAAKVWLSVRTPPNVILREIAGIPTQAFGIVFRALPPAVADAMTRTVQAVVVGDLRRYGLGKPPRGMYERAVREKQIPILDVGLLAALERRAVEAVPAVDGFEGAHVLLAGGARIEPHVVVAATGYRCGLEPLVGHLGLLDDAGRPVVHGPETHARAPGMHFIGYSNPISGNLREVGIDARAIARAIATNGHG